MQPTASEFQQAQERLAALKELLVYNQKLAAFIRTPEFKELIIDGYCRDEVSRFTHQSGDPRLDATQRADALSMAHSGGHFLRWLNKGEIQLGTIERDIQGLEEALRGYEADAAEGDE